MEKKEFVKGFLAQCIAENHMKLIDYNVVKTGREYISKELTSLSQTMEVFESETSTKTYYLYDKVISKMPDFIVYKTIYKSIKCSEKEPSKKIAKLLLRFMEVKFRTLNEQDLIIDENNNTIQIQADLDIDKYAAVLEHMLKFPGVDASKIWEIYFIVYLLASIKRNNNQKSDKNSEKSGSANKFYTMIAMVQKKNDYINLPFYAPEYIYEEKGRHAYENVKEKLEELKWEGFAESSFFVSKKAEEIFRDLEEEPNLFKYGLMSNEEIEEKVKEIFKR